MGTSLTPRYALVTLLLSSSLGACSSLIPPQTIPDPIGVVGRQVKVEIGSQGELSTTALGVGTIRGSFADFDTSSVPISVNLSQSLFKVGFATEARLATAAASLPCDLTLTRVDISVTLTDALQSYTLPTFKLNKVVELEQQASDPTLYRIVTEDVFVGVALSPDEVKRLQTIITTGGTNETEVRVSVQGASAPDLPPGSVLTLTFQTSEAMLTF